MKETIGNRIQKFRKEKGLTQEELAAKLGLSSQAVSKWENDASCPDIGLLPQICQLLEVTADELLSGRTETVKVMPEEKRKPFEELVMRVRVNSADGDKIKVNLPMPLVKIAMEIGVDVVPNMGGEHGQMLRSIDMEKVVKMVEHGLIGKLVEVESAQGDTVEVVVE